MNSTAHGDEKVRGKVLEVVLRGAAEWDDDGRIGPDAARMIRRQRWMTACGEPFTNAQVRCFTPEQFEKAGPWVESDFSSEQTETQPQLKWAALARGSFPICI